jgi:CheY-like chemotaxis protein
MPRLHRTRQFFWLTTKPPFTTPSGKFLRQTGNSVLEMGSPQDALCLAQFHQGEIPILLMDIVMPGVRGTDLAAKVRALRPNIEVICMSGYAEGIPRYNCRKMPNITRSSSALRPCSIFSDALSPNTDRRVLPVRLFYVAADGTCSGFVASPPARHFFPPPSLSAPLC